MSEVTYFVGEDGTPGTSVREVDPHGGETVISSGPTSGPPVAQVEFAAAVANSNAQVAVIVAAEELRMSQLETARQAAAGELLTLGLSAETVAFLTGT